jgi:hypothetical protein
MQQIQELDILFGAASRISVEIVQPLAVNGGDRLTLRMVHLLFI